MGALSGSVGAEDDVVGDRESARGGQGGTGRHRERADAERARGHGLEQAGAGTARPDHQAALVHRDAAGEGAGTAELELAGAGLDQPAGLDDGGDPKAGLPGSDVDAVDDGRADVHRVGRLAVEVERAAGDDRDGARI